MTEQHPITPPPELVQQWCRNWTHARGEFGVYLATQAARWGADQELEECCEWLGERDYDGSGICGAYLRAARRPKPPSLAEQALTQLQAMDQAGALDCNIDAIRRALKRLQELEKGND